MCCPRRKAEETLQGALRSGVLKLELQICPFSLVAQVPMPPSSFGLLGPNSKV